MPDLEVARATFLSHALPAQVALPDGEAWKVGPIVRWERKGITGAEVPHSEL